MLEAIREYIEKQIGRGEVSLPMIAGACGAICAAYLVKRQLFPTAPENVASPSSNFPLNSTCVGFFNHQTDLHNYLHEMNTKYESYWMNAMGVSIVITSNLDLVQHVYRKREVYPQPINNRKALAYSLGKTMFSEEGERWAQRHKVLQEMLKPHVLQRDAEVIYDKISHFVQMLEEYDGGVVNMVPLLKLATIDIIGQIAFGEDLQTLGGDETTMGGKLRSHFEYLIEGILDRFLLPFPFLWRIREIFSRAAKEEREGAKIFTEIFTQIMSKKEEEMRAQGYNVFSEDKVTNLVTLLLNSRKTNPGLYGRQEMIAECFSIFAAGHDTTALTTSFILSMFATHPEVQEKARKEALAFFAQNTGPIKLGDINKLVYIPAVIKETQRYYPVANAVVRQATCDDYWGNVHIRKGTSVMMNVYSIMRSPKYYENPDKFIPERWIAENSHTFPFFGFGFGMRSCFGQKIALLEMKIICLLILRTYVIMEDPNHPLKVEFKFGLQPKDKEMFVGLQKL